jgi:NADH dehydrogenase
MVSVGSRYAVADTGFKTSGWFAMLIKHFVNFYYQFLVSGVRQLWNYVNHEFFHVKNNRSFVGGHFAKRSPNFWLLPLRMWLGFMWLVEGVKKIDEGWLSEQKMYASTPAAEAGADATAAASGAADATAAASGAADATAAASGAVEGGAETVSNLPGFAQWIADHTPSGYGGALFEEVPGFMQWIIDHIVAPNAVPFQTVMVLMEIAIGLALIVGLFTFLSSIVSVGLTIGISLTGMSDATILWFFFGGIALIAGSGSTLGLDYYVLPRLKQWWKKTKFARKSYLYFD